MLAVRDNRWYVKCNECPVRMDVAPSRMPKEIVRMPSGWMDLGDNAHVCPQCAPAWHGAMTPRHQPATRSWRRF